MRITLLIFICALFSACFSEGDCLVSATNYMHIQFKKRSNHKLDTSVIFNYIYFGGSDSALGKTQATELLLPVDINNARTNTEFIFQIANSDNSKQQTDTLQVGYTRQGEVITKDCGAYSFYIDLKILKTSFDSAQVKVFSTSLLKDPTGSGIASYAINYQIYF
ncbi:MAG: hypothetical protein JST48_00965 [Bacteroidetes bacterium]|nr:hypothetical protein [Bacteroidota bacterium]